MNTNPSLKSLPERRLHLREGYKSLFYFICEDLKCSEQAAHQKLQALRLMKEIPAVEEKLKSGSLSLTTAAQIQAFSASTAKREIAVPSKLELIEQVEGKSKRETEKLLATYDPKPLRPDQ